MNGFWLALGFLTTLPARPVPYVPGGLGRAAAWFPGIGLLIGVLLLLVQSAAALLLGPAVAAVLVILLWAVLTGGLHLDGLADCCDGRPVSAPRADGLRLCVTRGGFIRRRRPGAGAAPQGCRRLFTARRIHRLAPASWSGCCVGACWWILLAARRPPARADGLGSNFGTALTPQLSLALPSCCHLCCSASRTWFDWRSLVGVAFSGLACLGVLRLAQARIGGMTGDVLGAVVELSEAAFLLAMVRP